jgi:hypothetical protein
MLESCQVAAVEAGNHKEISDLNRIIWGNRTIFSLNATQSMVCRACRSLQPLFMGKKSLAPDIG